MSASLIIQNVSKCYRSKSNPVQAVKDVSLSINPSEMVAIVGPSGSGKSTLLRIMGLLLAPDDGMVLIHGLNPANLGDSARSTFRNKTFGYIMQDFALLDDQSVYQNIRLPLIYHKGISRSQHRQRVQDAADRLGIADKLHRKASRLSGGERQRVAIARAIICHQSILLADEPTGSLDAANKENVMDIFTSFSREEGKSIVLVTHDLDVANRCDRILHLRDGALVSRV